MSEDRIGLRGGDAVPLVWNYGGRPAHVVPADRAGFYRVVSARRDMGLEVGGVYQIPESELATDLKMQRLIMT